MLRKLQPLIITLLVPYFALANTTSTNADNTIKYYCPTNKAYKEYKNGTGKLENVPAFSDEKSCENQCLAQSQCMFVGAKSSGTVVAQITNDSTLNLAEINKKLKDFPKIVGIKIVAGGIEAMSVSDLNGISLTELFVPVKTSDIHRGGIEANVAQDNVKITSIEEKSILLQLTKTSVVKNGENGTYKAEHKTRKRKIPMTQKEIDSLTPSQRSQLENEYQRALQNYKESSSIYNPSSAYVKDSNIDEQYTRIVAENGKVSEMQGWVNLALLVNLSYSDSQVEYDFIYFDEDTNKTEKQRITIPITNGYGEHLFYIEGTTRNAIVVGQDTLFFDSSVRDTKDTSKVFYSVEKNGSKISGEFEVEILNQDSGDKYLCQGNDTVMGDLGQNAFSNNQECNAKCLVKNVCVTISPTNNTTDPNCQILSSEFLSPITDSQGKTFYLGKKVTKKCDIVVDKTIGCRQYETQTTNTADLDSLFGAIPTIQTNKKNHDFSKAMNVFGTMALAENATHIFGAEAGYCDVGQFFPSAMDMVMLAIKYAMMVGSGVLNGATEGAGAAMSEAGDAAASTATNVVTKATSYATAAAKAGWQQFTSNLAKKATERAVEEVVKEVAKNAAMRAVVYAAGKVLQEQCDKSGIGSLCSKKEAKRTSAWVSGSTDSLLSNEELDGATDENDKIAMDYANCMTGRFGLTYESVLAWQMGTREVNELHYSFKVPMIIDGNELAILRLVMENKNPSSADDIDKYFYARYNLESAGEMNGKKAYALYALKGDDVLIAAETICGGVDSVNIIRKKYGQRFLNPDFANPTLESEYPPQNDLEETLVGLTEDSNAPTSDGTTSADTAFMVADFVAGALPFPFNIAASVVVDVLKQTQENGNTCTDMRFAERRAQKDPTDGSEYIRTNKRISLDLCNQVSDESRVKIAGKTILNRKHYCCYDQITTRIFAEGMMSQLGKKITRDNCAPLSIDDLNKVSFKACEANQKPDKDNCFPSDKFQELTKAYMSGTSIGVEEAVGGIVESVFQLKEH